MKKMTQKQFFELLARRAKRYGFAVLKKWPFWVREKRTGKCPVCAVAAELGIRVNKENSTLAAQKMGLDLAFADRVAVNADNPDEPKDPAFARKLYRLIGVKVEA